MPITQSADTNSAKPACVKYTHCDMSGAALIHVFNSQEGRRPFLLTPEIKTHQFPKQTRQTLVFQDVRQLLLFCLFYHSS